MAVVTFDGPNRLIIINAGVTSLDVIVDLYSDWKEWVLLSDNVKFFPAFRSIAGDPVSATKNVSGHVFLQNQVQPDGGVGWRIRPPEENTEIQFNGNIWREDNTLPATVPTLGGFTTAFIVERAADAFTVAGSSPSAIAAAVWAESAASPTAGTYGAYLASTIPGLVRRVIGLLFG